MKTVKLGPFLGMNNQLPPTQLKQDGQSVDRLGDYVRDAVNVDVLDSGTLRRRAGYEKLLDGECHSLYTSGDLVLLVRNGELGIPDRTATGWGFLAMCDVRGPVSYTTQGKVVYASDGNSIWQVHDGKHLIEHNIPVPQQPTLIAGVAGAMVAGLYRVVCTYVRPDGQESAASDETVIQVADNSVLTIRAPTRSVQNGWAVRVYMTPANGDEFYHAGDTQPRQELNVAVFTSTGATCQTRGLYPMPAGGIIRVYSGRLYVARGNVLYTSRPYAYALHDPVRGFFQFEKDITLLEAVEDGLYVCAGKTWFIPKDLSAMREVLPYGSMPGAGAHAPDGSAVYWFSERGAVRAGNGGEVQAIHDRTVAIPDVKDGCVAQVVREVDGVAQLVGSYEAGSEPKAAMRSFMDAEIIRKG